MTFAELLRATVYFPGEFEMIEEEFCGGFPTALIRLPDNKRQRLQAYLQFETAQRQAAVEEVRSWATVPFAAALKLLQDPAAWAAKKKAKPASTLSKTISAIGSWGDEE
jgi:hypothetical protein